MTETMRITFNGFEETVPELSTIANLLEFFKEGEKSVIVELNGRFVYPRLYDTTVVAPGDKLEFISPAFGG